MAVSQPPSTFEPAAYLHSLGRFGVQLGLDRMLALLQVLDRPQQSIPVIHVAGTNGKGSVCAMLSTVLSKAGYTVGRYTSPHLVSWRERLCINGEPISAADWQQVLWHVKEALVDYPGTCEPPTQFEIVTAAAWLYFQQQAVDVAVLEVGLGGRLDATNADISPCVSVITPIGRDHWQRLGETLTEIAGEKTGIIKPQVPVVCAPQAPEALSVITQTAKEREAPLVVVSLAQWTGDFRICWQDRPYQLSLLGDAQLSNVAVVLEAIAQLRQQGWTIPEEAIQTGLATTRWLGRLQWARLGDRKVLLDGAHNVPAAEILRQFLDRQFPNSSVTWCVGMLTTKDATGIFKALLRSGDRLYTLPIQDHLAFSPDELLAIAGDTGVPLQDTQTIQQLDELNNFLAQLPVLNPSLNNADPIVICGSLYMLGQLMERYPQLME